MQLGHLFPLGLAQCVHGFVHHLIEVELVENRGLEWMNLDNLFKAQNRSIGSLRWQINKAINIKVQEAKVILSRAFSAVSILPSEHILN